jgi:integrase
MKLDAKNIASVKLGDRNDLIVFDDQLAGFGYRLRQGAGGKLLKSFIAQYRHAGATRRVLLGPASTIKPEQARQAAKKLLAKVALGEDPQATRIERRAKDRQTTRAVVDEYLAVKQCAPNTRREITRYLTDPAYFGTLHRVPLDKVTRRDVASALVAIGRERGTTTAAVARGVLSAFFTWSMQMGLGPEGNPVAGTMRHEIEARDRVLDDDELAKIWKACGDNDFGRIVQLLILTGGRRSEVGGMAWSELELEAGTWTIPKERSKNGHAHTLPLMPAMLELIRAVRRRTDRDQLFGERHAGGFSQWSLAKQRLDERLGIAEWRLHDLRRTAASRLGDLGVQPHVVERILNHQSGHRAGVAGTYNRSNYTNEVRAALGLWANHVNALATGGNRKVVALKARP